jgi:hypothetical protein
MEEGHMNFEKAIEESKESMYYIFNQYSIDGYDSDDLFQETVIWILRDWKTIISLEKCKLTTAIINRAKWLCDFLAFYDSLKYGELTHTPVKPEDIISFDDFDFIHFMVHAENKLSPKAYDVLRVKMHSATRRETQEQLNITDRPYQTAIQEIKDFLNEEGIHCNR